MNYQIKGKKFLAFVMVFIMLFQLFTPEFVFADEKKKTIDNNIAESKTSFKKIDNNLAYGNSSNEKRLLKEVVLRILRDTTFKSTKYRELYTGGSASLSDLEAETGYQFGNSNLIQALMGSVDGDKDGKALSGKIKGIFWVPLYVSSKNGIGEMSIGSNFNDANLNWDDYYDDKKEMKANTPAHDTFVNVLGPDKKPKPRPLMVYDFASYEKTSCGVFGIGDCDKSSRYLVNEKSIDSQQVIGKDEEFLTRTGYMAKHSLYTYHKDWSKINYVGNRNLESISNSEFFPYALSRTSWAKYRTKFTLENTENTKNMKGQMVGVDSFGNIITNNLDVIIPFWANNTFDEFKDIFSNGYSFLSHPLLKDITQGNTAEFITFPMLNKKNNYYEMDYEPTKDKLFGENKIFDDYKKGTTHGTAEGSKKRLKALYSDDEDYLNAVADLIVLHAGDNVKAFNDRLRSSVKKMSEKDKGEAYITSSTGDYSEFLSETVDSLEEAKGKIYSAEGILAKIGEILDIGIFHLIKLTVAAGIADFYNSTVINFSIGEIFYTKLLSQSDIWKSAINTILLIVVSFMAVYLILMLVRLLMGYITIKGIALRFVILAIAVVSPMIIYSPLVDYTFNKPSKWVLSTEIDRMFLLDRWLQRWETVVEQDSDLKYILPSGNLRERSEEYTIPFYTSHNIKGYDLNTPEGMSMVGGHPHPDDVVVVNVSAFHLLEWAKDAEKDQTLFAFLQDYYGSEYDGIDNYEEFKYDPTMSIGDIKEYKGKKLTASELFRKLYENSHNPENLENSLFADNLYYFTNELFYGKEQYGNGYINSIIFDIASSDISREAVYGNPKGRSKETTDLLKKLKDARLPDSDLLDLKSIIKDLQSFRLDGDSDLANQVYEINKNVIDSYIYDYLSLRNTLSNTSIDGGYKSAEKEILVLKTFFEINKKFDIPLFPEQSEQSSVTLDTYVRAAFIPLHEFTPSATEVNNVANYISVRSDFFAMSFFALSLLFLFVYGLIKFVVLFVLLMPSILISFFYNYVWLENTKSKAWVGALGILGSFALVNTGLVLLWKGLIFTMNQSFSNKDSVGIDMYPVTIFHSSLIILFLIVAFHFIFRPLARAIKGDLMNLGGTTLSDGALKMTGNLKASLSNFWNNLSDSNARNSALGKAVSNTRLGGNLMSAFGAAKDALRGNKKDDKGMAGKLDPNQIKSNRTDAEVERDKEDVDKVTRKLSQNSMRNGSTDKNGLATGVSAIAGAAGSIADSAANVAVAGVNAKANATIAGANAGAKTVEAGANSLARVLGLANLGNILNSPNDDRSIFNKLKDAKDAAGQAWLESDAQWNSEKSQLAVARAKEVMAISEKMNSIPDLLDDQIQLDENDMSVLEETGMDKAISKVEDFTTVKPTVFDTGNALTAGIMLSALKDNNRAVSANSKVLVDMSEDDINDPSKRKQLLTPVLSNIEKVTNDLMNSSVNRESIGDGMVPHKISDKVYSLENNEITPHLVSYINKKKDEGLGVVLRNMPDGQVELYFGNEKDALSTVADIEAKSSSIAKALGIKSETSFDVDSSALSILKADMDKSGINYVVNEELDGITNISIEGGTNSVDSFREIFSNNSEISKHVNEISSGIEKVSNNALVSQLVSEHVESGNLALGTDVLIQNGSVYAKSNEAKRVLADVESGYNDSVRVAVNNLQDFALDVSRSIVGDPSGIGISSYVRGSDLAVESQLKGSELGKERYTLNNRSFDVETFNKTVNALETKRTKIDKEIKLNESELRTKKHEINNRINEIENVISEDLKNFREDLESNLKSLEVNFEKDKSAGNIPVHELQARYKQKVSELEKAFDDKKSYLINNYDKLNGDMLESLTSEQSIIQDKLNNNVKEKSRLFSPLESELLESVAKARANGMNWNRVDGTTLEFSSELKNQQELVKDLMDRYTKLSSQKPKNVNPRPEGPGPDRRASRDSRPVDNNQTKRE